MNQTPGFILDPTLAGDSAAVTVLALSEVRLINDSRFPWLILVPRRAGKAEIIDLDKPDRAALFEEISAVSATLRGITGCDKLNVAAIGNRVRQLHVHVVARFEGDAAWPGLVWNFGSAVAYAPAERDRLIATIRAALSR